MKKTAVIHGWDINILSLDKVFWKILILTNEVFSESQLDLRKGEKKKRKIPGEQRRHDLGAPQTNAIFVLNLENCVYFRCQTKSGRFGIPTIFVIKKQ